MSESRTEEGMRRLGNWAAWCRSGYISIVMRHYFPPVSPMFREVVGGYCGEEEDRQDVIDERDAETTEKRINEIAPLLRAAVLWRFLNKRTHNCIYHLDRMPAAQVKELVRQAARAL